MRWKTISAQWSIVFQLFKWSRSRSVFSAYSLHAVGKTLDCNSILKSVSICATKWPSNRPMYHCRISDETEEIRYSVSDGGQWNTSYDQLAKQGCLQNSIFVGYVLVWSRHSPILNSSWLPHIFRQLFFSKQSTPSQISILLPKSPYCVLNNANLCPSCGFFPVLSPSAPIPFPFNKLVACTPSP